MAGNVGYSGRSEIEPRVFVISMDVVSVRRTYLDGDNKGLWWVTITLSGGTTLITDVCNLPSDRVESYQEVIDGVLHSATQDIAYNAETDQMVFSRYSCPIAIARSVLAPKLATVMRLRQPTDLWVKPLDGF